MMRRARGNPALSGTAPVKRGGQSKLREKTTQQIDRSFRCRIKFDFLDVRELATVRDYYTVNRAVG